MKSSQPIITGSTLISCVLLFGINALLAENYLAIRYDMDITFMPAGGNNPAQITGINHITITNNWVRPLEDIYLHNNSNGYFSPEDKNTPHTVIGEVKSDHLDEVLERDAISMRITLDPPVPPGESLEVEVPFVTHIARNQNPFAPTMGSNEDTTIYNLIFFYPVLEYFHDDGWHIEAHQGKADPYSNMSEYQVTFTFPVGYQVGTSAHLVTADTLENEMARWRLYYPKAISFSAVLSEKFKFKREEIENDLHRSQWKKEDH